LQDPGGPRREDVAYEASLRLANSITSKHEHYASHYSREQHVVGKPFVLAIAPFEQPHFEIQRLDRITNALYAAKLGEVRKPNGRTIPLGFFLNDQMANISAVIFSNVATYGKVVASPRTRVRLAALSQRDTATKNSIHTRWKITPKPCWTGYSSFTIHSHDFLSQRAHSSNTGLLNFSMMEILSSQTFHGAIYLSAAV
jgi:hypothetical protein